MPSIPSRLAFKVNLIFSSNSDLDFQTSSPCSYSFTFYFLLFDASEKNFASNFQISILATCPTHRILHFINRINVLEIVNTMLLICSFVIVLLFIAHFLLLLLFKLFVQANLLKGLSLYGL
jgi:hypothetical protein